MELTFELLGAGDYERAKKVLDRAKHPGFVGRELFFRCATNGGCIVAVRAGQDVGVALVTKGKLQALSVVQDAQGGGVGRALMGRTRPKFVNAIGEKIGWFEKLGYKCVGAPRVGANGKHSTQLLELVEPEKLSGSPPAAKDTPTEPAKPPNRLTADEQVDHIVKLMVTREWRAGASHKELASAWGCHPRTVGDRAIIASGILARTGGPLEQWVESKMRALDELETQAASDGNVIAAIKAIQLQMDIRGVTSTRRQKDDKPAEHDDEYAKLSKEERIVRLKAALAEEMAVEDGSNGMH